MHDNILHDISSLKLAPLCGQLINIALNFHIHCLECGENREGAMEVPPCVCLGEIYRTRLMFKFGEPPLEVHTNIYHCDAVPLYDNACSVVGSYGGLMHRSL